jgi:DMSO/TMAO reductase YedYZ molybdopterin-dependent catalytic subunit
VGNVRFAGVPLAAVLQKYNVRVDPQVKYVTAEGHDLPKGLEKPDFEHSLPVADVLEKSILALKLNGESLPGVHGGPVRLVTPGFFGTMQVKWLARLRFETAESPNFYHATEYRVPLSLLKPGEKFRFTLENSRPTWVIRLMSYILDPVPGAKLKAGAVRVSGVAYNGSARLESVLVSFDRGHSWQPAEFQAPDSPYAWYQWTVRANLKPGLYEICSRAIDALGRTQPLGEIPATLELTQTSKTKVFTQALATNAAAPVAAAGQMVMHPVDTVTGLPAGVGRFFGRVGLGAQKIKEAATEPEESSAGEGRPGYHAHVPYH